MGMRLSGMAETILGVQNLKGEMREAAQDAVDDATERLMVASQIQVPKDTTALANTAEFVDISRTGNVRSRAVRYGQPGEGPGIIDYAAAVHEILKARHALPTKAKYVEDPLLEGIPFDKETTAVAVKRAVKRAF